MADQSLLNRYSILDAEVCTSIGVDIHSTVDSIELGFSGAEIHALMDNTIIYRINDHLFSNMSDNLPIEVRGWSEQDQRLLCLACSTIARLLSRTDRKHIIYLIYGVPDGLDLPSNWGRVIETIFPYFAGRSGYQLKSRVSLIDILCDGRMDQFLSTNDCVLYVSLSQDPISGCQSINGDNNLAGKGEGAVCILLASPETLSKSYGKKSHFLISAIGRSELAGSDINNPRKKAELSHDAFYKTRASLDYNPVAKVIMDYQDDSWCHEFSVLKMRNRNFFSKSVDVLMPSRFYGDLHASSDAALIAIASRFVEISKPVMVFLSDGNLKRCCVLIEVSTS